MNKYEVEKEKLNNELNILIKKEELDKIRDSWDRCYSKICKDIYELENKLNNAKDKKEYLICNINLQTLYEQRDIAEKYEYLLSSTDNIYILRKVLCNNIFQNENIVDDYIKEYEDDKHFKSYDYKKKEKLYKVIEVLSVILTPTVLAVLILGCLAAIVMKFRICSYRLISFDRIIMWGLLAYGWSSPVTLPLFLFLGSYVIPKIVSKIMFKSRISPELEKHQTQTAVISTTAGIVGGISAAKHIRNNPVIIKE